MLVGFRLFALGRQSLDPPGNGVRTDQPKDLVTQLDRQNIHDVGETNAIVLGTLLDLLLNIFGWLVFFTDEIEA